MLFQQLVIDDELFALILADLYSGASGLID
jgi:hypothetical protein